MKMPNGKTLLLPRSTANLDTAAFNDYMTAVEAWANEHDVYLDEMPALNHCEFCSLDLDDDLHACPKCKDYKGIVPGSMAESGEDEEDER